MPRAFGLTIVATILALNFVVPVSAGPVEDGREAYYKGDYATALRLIHPAAERGNADAQKMLGDMYAYGMGVPKDFAEAIKWHRLAAEQGHVDAQFALALTYLFGDRGALRDDAEAVRWYRRAAEGGNASAQRALASMYAAGLGVPKNYVRAYMWFNLAAAQGHKTAVNDRDTIAQRMTRAQVAEAQKLAREWKPVAPVGSNQPLTATGSR